MPKYTDVYQIVEQYRHQSAESLRVKFEPVYRKYYVEVLADKLGCNLETVRKFRSKKSPRKPNFECYLLLLTLLEEQGHKN